MEQRSKIRIHIVGPPRSGTTLMHQIAVNCYAVDGYAPEEMPVYYEPSESYPVFCSKWPLDVLQVERYLAFMPNLWVISMQRDPRDVVTSIHGSAPDMYFSNLRQWRECRRAEKRLESHPRVARVRYEDLVRDPDKVERFLRSRLPFLKQTRPFTEFHVRAAPSPQALEALHRIRPIDSSSIGAWRFHKERLAAQLECHGSVAVDLIELGYERDDAWMSELDGVRADNHRSLYAERVKLTPRRALMRSKRSAAVAAALLQHRLVRPVLGRPLYLQRETVTVESRTR